MKRFLGLFALSALMVCACGKQDSPIVGSLTDALDKNHANELLDANKRLYTNSVSAGHSKMVVLTFYFE